MRKNVVITGVGGQGTVLASRILAKAGLKAGYEVRTSETIGMAQREGAVTSQIRFGDDLTGYGPLIPAGEADVLLSFELAEAVRGVEKLADSGTAIINQKPIIPITVSLGDSSYQVEELRNYLEQEINDIYKFGATKKAKEAGNYKAMNVVMLGALANLGKLGLDNELLLETVLEMVPDETKEINRRAFWLGSDCLD